MISESNLSVRRDREGVEGRGVGVDEGSGGKVEVMGYAGGYNRVMVWWCEDVVDMLVKERVR